ncbi:MAG: hypothetical protein E7307_13245 [Butyrivibrio sp.]|nr:hypothetical protein [Butyrivibrio sp.]
MKNIAKVIAAVLVLAAMVTTFNVQAFAYSDIPDYFDFGDCTVSIDAGSYKDVWVRSNYKYTCYLGAHTSSRTYIECTEKAGSEYVRLHIGPDETEKNVIFYFYVRDDAVADQGLYDEIEVYVQNIDYEYAKRADEAAFLKWYAYNNKDFNAYDYYMNYPDLRNAYGLDANSLYTHYYTTGIFEHRVANKLL